MKPFFRAVACRPTACTQPIFFHHGFATSCASPFRVSLALASSRNTRKKKYDVFKSMVNSQFNKVVDDLSSSDIKYDLKGFGISSSHALANEVVLFRKTIAQAMAMAERGNDKRSENPLFWTLRNAFIRGDMKGLASELRYSFQSFMIRARLSGAVGKSQKRLADFRYPMEWFPATRALQRTVHLHVGPTNSGKTYHALKALESANSGIYGGPLRLLAQEIHARFLAKGKPCAMITGEEQRIPEDADNYFISCTVEMTPLNRVVDVAVIDEIQMIGDPDRGWAWTQALLGVMAKEVHLCGEERAVDLIRSICAAIGDKCVVHRYQRLSPLATMTESLNNDLRNLRKGDAVIGFSRVNLHGLKKAIEEETGRRCAIVYGSLPPETRAQQAALFNDPDNDYDFLVASDAVGMGLNLEIKRVVFETVTKFDGVNVRRLTTSEMKQIGGRAGRFRTARQAASAGDSALDIGVDTSESKKGLVTSLDHLDLEAVQDAFQSEAEPLEAAYISPPGFILERFSEYLPPDVPLSFMLLRIRELARTSPIFLAEVSSDALAMADVIQSYPLTIHERLSIMNAPVTLREPGMTALMQAMAKCLATREGGGLCDLKEIQLEMLDKTEEDFHGNSRDYLRRIENLHHAVSLYLWMSYRFPSVFMSQKLAFHVKDLVQAKIEQYLDTAVSFRSEKHQALRGVRRQEAIRREREQQRIFGSRDAAASAAKVAGEQGPGRWNEPGHEEPLVEEVREYNQLETGDASSH